MNVDIPEADDVHITETSTAAHLRPDRPDHPGVNQGNTKGTQTKGIIRCGDGGNIIIATNFIDLTLVWNNDALPGDGYTPRVILEDSAAKMTSVARIDWKAENLLANAMTCFKLRLKNEQMPQLLNNVKDAIVNECHRGRLQTLVQDLFEQFGIRLFGLNEESLVFILEHPSVDDAELTLSSQNRRDEIKEIFYKFLPDWVKMHATWSVVRHILTPSDVGPSYGYADNTKVPLSARVPEDLKSWAEREGLSEKTVQVLVDEDFTTLNDVKELTPEEVVESFQKTKLLPFKQCLTLKKAVARLASGATGFAPQSPTVHSAAAAMSSMAVGESDVDALVTRGRVKERAQLFDKSSPTEPKPSAGGQRWTPGSTVKGKENTSLKSPLTGGEIRKYQPPFFRNEQSHLLLEGRYGDTSLLSSVRNQFTSYWRGDTEEKPKEVFRFILLGKIGSGKSTTGNTILGEKKFEAGMTFSSVTSICDFKSVDRDGKVIEIMDCPGLYDTSKSQTEISTVIVQAVAGTHPGPHAILYVIRLGRFTAEEYGVYNRLKALFDDHVVDYMILLFTGGDDLEKSGKSFADLMNAAPKELVEVLSECGNRRLVFNNNAKNTKQQVKQLLDMVRSMNEEHEDKPYMCPKYGMIGEGVEKEVQKRLEELVQRKDLEREKYVLELEAKTKDAQIAVEERKKEMERKDEERKRTMDEERERMKQEEEQKREELKAMADQLTQEKRELEEKQLRSKHEKEKRELQHRLEKEKEGEVKRLQRKIEEQKELEEENLAEARLKREAYDQELRRFKKGVAKNEEQGWVDWAAGGVATATGWLFR